MKKTLVINAFVLLSAFSIRHYQMMIQHDGKITAVEGAATQYFFFQDDGIIGSWSLQLQAFDKNSNGKLDEVERQQGNTGRHFYQFNADGTCLIHTMKLKGYYELKSEGTKRRLYTYVYDEGKPVRENAWYVISVSKTELVLLSQDKYAFWIYKRV